MFATYDANAVSHEKLYTKCPCCDALCPVDGLSISSPYTLLLCRVPPGSSCHVLCSCTGCGAEWCFKFDG